MFRIGSLFYNLGNHVKEYTSRLFDHTVHGNITTCDGNAMSERRIEKLKEQLSLVVLLGTFIFATTATTGSIF